MASAPSDADADLGDETQEEEEEEEEEQEQQSGDELSNPVGAVEPSPSAGTTARPEGTAAPASCGGQTTEVGETEDEEEEEEEEAAEKDEEEEPAPPEEAEKPSLLQGEPRTSAVAVEDIPNPEDAEEPRGDAAASLQEVGEAGGEEEEEAAQNDEDEEKEPVPPEEAEEPSSLQDQGDASQIATSGTIAGDAEEVPEDAKEISNPENAEDPEGAAAPSLMRRGGVEEQENEEEDENKKGEAPLPPEEAKEQSSPQGGRKSWRQSLSKSSTVRSDASAASVGGRKSWCQSLKRSSAALPEGAAELPSADTATADSGVANRASGGRKSWRQSLARSSAVLPEGAAALPPTDSATTDSSTATGIAVPPPAESASTLSGDAAASSGGTNTLESTPENPERTAEPSASEARPTASPEGGKPTWRGLRGARKGIRRFQKEIDAKLTKERPAKGSSPTEPQNDTTAMPPILGLLSRRRSSGRRRSSARQSVTMDVGIVELSGPPEKSEREIQQEIREAKLADELKHWKERVADVSQDWHKTEREAPKFIPEGCSPEDEHSRWVQIVDALSRPTQHHVKGGESFVEAMPPRGSTVDQENEYWKNRLEQLCVPTSYLIKMSFKHNRGASIVASLMGVEMEQLQETREDPRIAMARLIESQADNDPERWERRKLTRSLSKAKRKKEQEDVDFG